ncbi:MAG: M13 family metallopeptidase [Kofleriaceae bacterium]
MGNTALVVIVLGAALGCGRPGDKSPAVMPAPANAHGVHGIATGDLMRKTDPCSDFFEYATGGWQAANPIPTGLPRWGRRAAARDANKAKIQRLLEALSARSDWEAGSTEQLLGDHYASCMDTVTIGVAGLTPLAPLLADIGGANTVTDVQRLIGRLHELAIPVGFSATGGLDYHEPTQFIEVIGGGRLGLPDRDHYLSSEPRFAEARANYHAHVATVFTLTGMTREGDDRCGRHDRARATPRGGRARPRGAADPTKTDHKLTFAKLQGLAPHFDWARYFDAAKLPRIDLNVAEPRLLQQFDHELAHTPIAAWRAYLTWQLLDSASPWLSTTFADQASGLADRVVGGASESRAQRCADSTEALLGDALGKAYVEAYFPPAAKAKVQAMIADLLALLKDAVGRIDWMTPATKHKALAKLATYRAVIGSPDAWMDYTGLVIRRDTLWGNVAAARQFKVADNRARVGKPADPLWELSSAASASPYLDLQLNEIVLPAGYLQPPMFDRDATDAVNLGAIGVSVAHDLTHSIDTLGAENDPQGRPVNWWTGEDHKAFASRGQCVVDQFESYFIEPGVHHQGTLVLRESVGDLAGLRLGYQALARAMAARTIPTVDGFTPEQQFFIAGAQARGEAIRIETQREMVKSDPHATSKFRINGALSGMPEFHAAFSCKPGDPMVRPPEQRCAIW